MNRGIRLVHAGRIISDGIGRTLCRNGDECAAENGDDGSGDLPCGGYSLCGYRSLASLFVYWAFGSGGSACAPGRIGLALVYQEFFRRWPIPSRSRVLLIRFSISQMDVPARQSYIMAVVSKEERSAAAGITGVARTTGAAISPLFVGFMFARHSWINVPFFLAEALKIVYDLLLYKEFSAIQAPER